MHTGNPLLEAQFEIPFDKIHASHIEPALDQLIERSRAHIDAIIGVAGNRTWDNTMDAYDRATEDLDRAITIARHLESVVTTPELRAAVNAAQPKASSFYSGLALNEGLYKALKAYAATADGTALEGVRRRFVEKTLDSFKRAGAELDAPGKVRMAEIDVELSKLTMKFGENVLDATNDFEIVLTHESELAGLPPSAVGAARQSAASKGLSGWRFTLQAPSYTAVISYLDDRKIREKIARAFFSRATAGDRNNLPILTRILELRREKATLLGYKNFADMVIADRMAKTGDAALEFIRVIEQRTAPFLKREIAELEAFRNELVGPAEGAIQLWDVPYFAEKLREKKLNFNEEELRPYFPLPQVIQGMFEICRQLFGIKVTEHHDAHLWHSDVRYYDIHDQVTAEHLGSFYSDLYPRESKRGGAWMDAFIAGKPGSTGWSPHLGLICGNMTPPLDDKPALLTHRDVQTLFHEFGHLLHHCLSRVEIRSLTGTNVAWDFVELPSQILENWCSEELSLRMFARHYETGEPLPADLLEKVKESTKFRAASTQIRQVSFSTMDLLLHMEYDPAVDGEVLEYTRKITARYAPAPLPSEHAVVAAFTHLFSSPVGYGAGYYSYKWAEVLDADAFSRFRHEGVLNPKTGADFRHKILAKGNSDDPINLYQNFMGREPDPEPMLERLGLN